MTMTATEVPTAPAQWELFLAHHWPTSVVDRFKADEQLRQAADSAWRLGDRFKVMAVVREHVHNDEMVRYIQGSYDWAEVFKYAGHGMTEDWTIPEDFSYGDPPQLPKEAGTGASLAPCHLKDIKRVVAHWNGENDEDNWEGVFELYDGRFLYVEAGCDYTGWG